MKPVTIFLVALIAVALLFVSVQASEMVLRSTGLVADFKQKMPCLMLYPPTNNTNITAFYHNKYAYLQEVGNDTAVVSQIALDTKLNWGFSDPFTKKDDNGSVIYTAVNLTSSFNMNGHIVRAHFVWYMYQKDATVKNGNENVTVYANSLKWAILVEGWPFKSADNSLQFVNTLAYHNSDKNETLSEFDLNTNSSATEPTSVHVPGDDDQELLIEFSNTANVDGYTGSLVKFAKNETQVLIRFDSFNNFLSYDPVARIAPVEDGTNWLLYIILGVIAILVLVVAVIGIAGFAVYKLVLEKRSPRYVQMH